jgi:DNA transposition AAA+ family ATPase
MGMEAVKLYTNGKSLAERTNNKLTELKMSKAELALSMSYSRSAVSQYLNGKYNSDPAALEEKLEEFLKKASKDENVDTETNMESAFSVKNKIQFFESKDFVSTIGICNACQENMALGIVVGKSGYGKTHALKRYANMPRVAYIECDDTMACRDLVEAIETALGMPRSYGGTIWSRVNHIREFFNVNQGYLIIIDEADKLINKYTQKKMEILRGIFDQADVGMVIAGEPRLEAEIKGNLVRFANRMDFYYKLQGLTKEEVKKYLEGYEIDELALNEFMSRACNTQTGCFRLLDRTLNNVIRILKESGSIKVTTKIINEASSMMML